VLFLYPPLGKDVIITQIKIFLLFGTRLSSLYIYRMFFSAWYYGNFYFWISSIFCGGIFFKSNYFYGA